MSAIHASTYFWWHACQTWLIFRVWRHKRHMVTWFTALCGKQLSAAETVSMCFPGCRFSCDEIAENCSWWRFGLKMIRLFIHCCVINQPASLTSALTHYHGSLQVVLSLGKRLVKAFSRSAWHLGDDKSKKQPCLKSLQLLGPMRRAA